MSELKSKEKILSEATTIEESNQVGVVKSSRSGKKEILRKVLNGVGIALCVLLLPILVLNCIMIVKGMVNPDEVPSIGSYVPLIVLTDSMYDEIKSGDLIICKKATADEIDEDMVISFFDPEGTGTSVVTHRVKRVDNEDGVISFRTQGDNNEIEDRVSVPQENLIGIWTGVRFGLIGHVVLFMQSTVGLLLCIFVPVMAFVVYQVFARKKNAEVKQSDIDILKAELEALKAAQTQTSSNPTAEQTAELTGEDKADGSQ